MRKTTCWLTGLAIAAMLASPLYAAFAPDRSAPDCGIQTAIDARSREGGGVVLLPAGEFAVSRYLFLRHGVTLQGAGEGKTILTVANPPKMRRLLGQDKETKMLDVEGDLSSLRPGMTVSLLTGGLNTWSGHIGYPTVASVSGQHVALTNLDLNSGIRATNSNPYLLFGHVTRLAEEAVPSNRWIRVTDPGICKPGHAFTLTGKGDLWDYHYNVMTAVTGDTVYLERPLTVTAPTGSLVKLAFALITSEWQERIGVESLTLRGIRTPTFKADWSGFQLAAFHTRNCTNVTLRNVTVENWNADGISIQGGAEALVEQCTSTGCTGHGFHPGTGLVTGLFTRVHSAGNGGDGLYYCWHNEHVDVVDSIFTNNGHHGVGGLGIPGDMHCTVARNLIADNGAAGVNVTGGPDSGNRVLNNTIRDNSRKKPGEWPGVTLYALYQEGSSGCLVASNTIESTLESPTQWVGIEERHSKPSAAFSNRADKATGLHLSDKNTILANTLRGHKTADIVVAGPRTTVGEGQGIVKHATVTTTDVPK
jgi:hypothetical protein